VAPDHECQPVDLQDLKGNAIRVCCEFGSQVRRSNRAISNATLLEETAFQRNVCQHRGNRPVIRIEAGNFNPDWDQRRKAER
jgi:hypothetical protein